MEGLLVRDPAAAAYDGLAPHYDALTVGHDYDRWIDVLERLGREYGLSGKRLLDVACGTGKSFLPMLERGYEVMACDLSPAMVERAGTKVVGHPAEVFVADMRRLPELGVFDLVTCLDDAVNYLVTSDELRAALEGFARNLRPGGLAIFDANTLTTYRTTFAGDAAMEADGASFRLLGEGSADAAPGGFASLWIEVVAPGPDGRPQRLRTRHRQRHHPRAEVERAVTAAGLELAAVRGQFTSARLDEEADEERHTKLVYIVRRPF